MNFLYWSCVHSVKCSLVCIYQWRRSCNSPTLLNPALSLVKSSFSPHLWKIAQSLHHALWDKCRNSDPFQSIHIFLSLLESLFIGFKKLYSKQIGFCFILINKWNKSSCNTSALCLTCNLLLTYSIKPHRAYLYHIRIRTTWYIQLSHSQNCRYWTPRCHKILVSVGDWCFSVMASKLWNLLP